MIRSGMRTKEIAQIRGVSAATINRHREHIRRKLKITNSDVNLVTYLQSSMWKGEL
jgi:DNA-binding CsgD family transcriptional regulator